MTGDEAAAAASKPKEEEEEQEEERLAPDGGAAKLQNMPTPSPRGPRRDEAGGVSRKASVLILYTGGTFGMIRESKGGPLVPSKGILRQVLGEMWELSRPESPSYDLLEWEDPKDSSDFDPVCWVTLARQVEEHYYDYDGFVVLHGTDTMAYTASALSFMLANLAKPVVVTGAVIPLGEVYNDAKRNLIVSMLVASQGAVPEVVVFFNDALYRGNRCKKVDPDALDAFSSPNFPELATIGPTVRFNQSLFRPAPVHPFRVLPHTFSDILVVSLTPGFSDSFLVDLARNSDSRPRGLVLSLYGYGNAPVNKKGFLDVLRGLVETNTEIVVCSQCLKGRTSLGTYATGRALLGLGLIEAGDQTLESTVTKLSFLMGSGMRGAELRDAMQSNLRGELTEDHGERRSWADLGPSNAAHAAGRPPEQRLMRGGSLQGVYDAVKRRQPVQRGADAGGAGGGAGPPRQCSPGECSVQ